MLDHFSPPGASHWLPAAVLTAFYYPLAYWSLMGMETGLQALLAVVAVQLALTTAHSGRDRNFALWIVCAAAFLLRMDMLLLVAAVQLYVLLQRGFRQIGTRSWLAGFAVFCGMTLAYGVFRELYYHDLLPNTYYLKLYGVPLAVRLLRGSVVLAEFVRDHLLVLLAAGLGTGGLPAAQPAADPAGRGLRPLLRLQRLRGRGRLGRRPADPGQPLHLLRDAAPLRAAQRHAQRGARGLAAAAGAGMADGDPAGRLRPRRRDRRRPADRQRALALRRRPNDNWREVALVDRPPMTMRHQRVVAQLLAFEKLVKPGAVVATAWAGIPAYFSDYKMIDILGYNDRVVAHMTPVTPLDEDNFDTFRPGHSKWNEQRLLTEQRPDAFFQIWGIKRGMGPVAKVLPGYGYRRRSKFWVRADSPFVDLQKAPPPPAENEEEPAAGNPPAPAADTPGAPGAVSLG